MKNQFKIGSLDSNEIVIKDKDCPNVHAEINYYRGNWFLKNLVPDKPIFINGVIIEDQTKLNKTDKIRISNKTIYWSNYLYEGETQELNLKDIISFNGRISRSNFRVLSLFSIGVAICIFFLPGLLVSFSRRKYQNLNTDAVNTIQEISPIIYSLGFSAIGIILLLLAIKRIRDTGNSIWKLLIPIYNLGILFFEKSKK